ncbi:ROK family protein [Klebsiella oxytoca]|uniref:ROK family transcriptional regulator n=1 Tax=Klebsiella oxytoca TaxID=571 RepID=UPI00066D3C47|nr:ROK family transcriptional regulator [Klebsiella oxytoca]EJA2383048.1 ROK family transcriptional regulator [Klebsiella oxytoca]EJZ8302410.1 ROK family transcriptional regulator [Klebsiella oxytoca]EKM0803325.1 ROK family transcriptional regulator [Klebsiella oxytoca]EKT7900202.1 ROK family transcriptional regulator [Klebsiella oxytoca]ELI3673980.1 ROK family transcriptional regulator [Klebsiella oxytoca]
MKACINNQQIRHYNKGVLLEYLYRKKRASKSTLARLAQISIPAVSNILQELEEEGRVVNVQDDHLSRGHSSGAWLIAPDGDWTLCMNITPTSIECQLGNACLSPKGEVEYHAIDAPTPQSLLTAIEKCWHQYRKNWPNRKINMALAVHGQVDAGTGVSQTMPQAPWKQPVEMKYLLEEKLNVRVMVDNDCVMLALAEKWQNDGQYRDFCVINVDYGIGSSFVINDQVWRGSLYGSGQIGHTIINPDGVACDCGRYGCLETVASLSALKKQARMWLKTRPDLANNPETLTIDALIDKWQQGDSRLQAWVEESANAIGLSLYNFLNILNINNILLYGRSCGFGEKWLNIIIRQTGFNPFDHRDTTRIRATQIGFGTLTRAQQLMGIGYLYVEEQLQTLR